MAFEGLEIAQGLAETLRDTPFGHFVRGLFGQDLFDAQVGGGDVAGANGHPVEAAASSEVAEITKIIDKVIDEASVNEPITLVVRTEIGFEKYINYLMRDLRDMQDAAEPLTGLDVAGIAYYNPSLLSMEQAQAYFDTVNRAMEELKKIQVELEQIQKDGVDGGGARAYYASDFRERLASAQSDLAKAASSIRGPVLVANA